MNIETVQSIFGLLRQYTPEIFMFLGFAMAAWFYADIRRRDTLHDQEQRDMFDLLRKWKEEDKDRH